MAIGKWIFSGAAQPVSNTPVVAAAPPQIISAADAKQFGLENFGNTCYANSVLQALYFCGPFRELLVQYPDPTVPDVATLSPPSLSLPLPVAQHPVPPPNVRRKTERKQSMSDVPQLSSPLQQASSSSPNPQNGTVSSFTIPPSPPTLLSALRSLYLFISKNPADKGTVAPRAFIDKLKELNELFRSSMHQDAHEFLNYLLNRIVEEIEDDRKNGVGNSIGRNSSGEDLSKSIATVSTAAPTTVTTESTARWSSYHTTIVHRLFEGVLTNLSIDIEQNSSVTACLRQFSASEMLCQKNKFFCDSCCGLQEAEKRMKIKKLPNVLALHLKRFKYQEDVQKYIKLAYRVAFPLELRLFNTVDDAQDPDRLYELFAIVVHIGNGPHHGHYVTIIKSRGVWLLFDDDSVETIKESDIPNYFGDSPKGSAYVLYYQAVDLDMVALGLRQQAPPAPPTPSTAASGSGGEKIPSLEVSKEEAESPALPPGLAEPDLSDIDEVLALGSPAIPAGVLPKEAQPNPPDLVVSIPPLAPPTGPPTPGGSHKLGGLLSSLNLRNQPSRRADGNGSGTERKSLRDSIIGGSPLSSPASPALSVPRRPATSHSTSTTDTNHHGLDPSSPIPSSPSAWRAMSNDTGRDRLPEKKSSGWFKIRSSRAETSFSAASSGPSVIVPDRGASTVRDKGNGRLRGSQVLKDGAFLDTASSRPSTGDASLPGSPVPPFREGSSPSPPPGRLHSEHKKSLPEFTRSKKVDRHRSLTGRSILPPRPSTAEATVGSSSSRHQRSSSVIPPIPPMPVSPGVAMNGNSLTAESQQPKGKDRDDTNSRSAEALHEGNTHHRERSGTIPVPVGLGFTPSESTTSSLSVSEPPVHTSSNWGKRATRKLSLTAPMLGFGRKDKDRHKDKDKDRDHTPVSGRDR